MADRPFYDDQLTEEEKRVGFVLVQTADPMARFYHAPDKVPAVVLHLNETDRIIKLNGHRGGPPTYHLFRFGYWAGLSPNSAAWNPLDGMPYPTPEMAIAAAKGEVRVPGGQQLEIVPVVPGEKY